MNKEKIIAAIEKWNQTQKDALIWTKDLTGEQIENIKELFARDTDMEDWIAFYDDSFRKKGKKGYLFSGKKIYGTKLHGPIDLEMTARILKEGVELWQQKTDGSMKRINCVSALTDLLPLLYDITGYAQEKQRPDERYTYLKKEYAKELSRRFRLLVNQVTMISPSIQSVETVDEQLIQNAIEANEPGLSADQVIAIVDRTDASGKRSTLITWDGIYCPTMNKGKMLRLDGLEQLIYVDGALFLGIYENGFTERFYLDAPDEEEQPLLKLVNGILDIYRRLHLEIQSGRLDHFGLDVSAGWEAFDQMRKENTLDTYKNAVFVSSTFRDMHFERDIIHEKVQPSLQALAEKYGESLSFCDLRWGVNTEELDSEEGAKKVLIVCLDEIERCNPYMLILLGERYGWIPNNRTVKNALEGRPEFVLDELEKSVTALEIEFGALTKDTPKERIFVYFRELKDAPSDIYGSEDAHHAQKLSELKARVSRLVPDRVKSYSLSWNEESQSMDGMDVFAQMVIADIGQVMEKEWQSREKRSWFEEELAQHWSYAEKKAALCCARDPFLQKCLKYLSENHHLMALQGISGCGKSTLMGALAEILKYSNTEVLPLFCGLTDQTDAAIKLVQLIVYQLELLLEQTHISEEKETISDDEYISRMNQLAERYSAEKEKPLMILLDAVDQLPPEAVRNNLKFIPDNISALSSKVNLILSCLDDFALPGVPLVQQVPLLEEEHKPAVISGILKRNRRELDRSVIEAITRKNASDSPLYLTLLIQRLLMMNKNDFDDIASDGDGMFAITKHQLKIVSECGETISDICRETLEMAARRIGGDFVKTAIECIAASRHGLREKDLEGLLTRMGISWNRLEFSIFINYVRNILVLREDECYDFTHKIIRQEITSGDKDPKELHRYLFQWFFTLPKYDILRKNELLYHCIAANDAESFIHYIKELIKDKELVDRAVNDIVTYCRKKDQGLWLSKVLSNIVENKIDIDSDFFRFLAYDVLQSFGSSDRDLNIRERIALPLLELAEYLAEIKTDLESLRAPLVMTSRLGYIYQLKKDERAFDYFTATITKSVKLADTQKEGKLYVDLAVDYYGLADTYIAFGSEERRKKARTYYEKSVEVAEFASESFDLTYAKRTLGWSYMKLGDFCYEEQEREKALEYYEKCMHVREQVLEEEKNKNALRNLANAYREVGWMYEKPDPQKALALFEKELHCREMIVQEERTLINLENLGRAQARAAGLLYKSEREDERKKALAYYDACIPVFEESLKAEEDFALTYMQVVCCDRAIQILADLGGTENHLKLERYADYALYWCEYRAQKTDDPGDYELWIGVLGIYAGKTQSLSKSLKCIEQGIELCEMIYKRTKDKYFKEQGKLLKLMKGTKKILNKF